MERHLIEQTLAARVRAATFSLGLDAQRAAVARCVPYRAAMRSMD